MLTSGWSMLQMRRAVAITVQLRLQNILGRRREGYNNLLGKTVSGRNKIKSRYRDWWNDHSVFSTDLILERPVAVKCYA